MHAAHFTTREARSGAGFRSALGALGVLAMACLPAWGNDCVDASCLSCLIQQLEDCENTFEGYDEGALLEACENASGQAYVTCFMTGGGNRPEINAAWLALFFDLQECDQLYSDPEAIQMCIDNAYENFEDALEAIDTVFDQACHDQGLNPISGLHSFTLTDFVNSGQPGQTDPSRITAPVGTIVALPGVGTGTDRNATAMPCVHSSHLVATYRTKNGVVTEFVDHDLNPADGSPMSYYLDPAKLLHADQVSLSAIFLDGDGLPVFFETGSIGVLDSPISGDYNRDSTTDNLDLIDYLDAYGNEVRRADINENQSVESGDMGSFVDDFAGGM